MSDTFYDPHTCMGFMTYTANRLLVASLHRQMAEVGANLTAEQWGILMQFWNRGDVTQEELIRGSGVDKSTVSRALGVMERAGLIARRLDPSDTRRKILSLTVQADTLKEKCVQAVQASLEQALRGIEPEDRETCLKVLAMVKQNLQEPVKEPKT